MALKYKLDADSFDKLEEDQKLLYKKDGDVYLLDVDGIETNEDLTGLKNKVDELLGEKKALEKRRNEESEQARLAAEQKSKESGDFKQLYESQKQEAERFKTELETLNERVKTQSLSAEASRIAATLTKDTARARLLTRQIESRLRLTDEGFKVTDEAGNLTVSTVDDLTANIKTVYPFLVDGSQASGGAASGSKGGAGDSQKQVTRSAFEGMGQVERAAHAKAGGKIVDD